MNFSIKSLLTACLVVFATIFLSCSEEFLTPTVPGALTETAIQGTTGIENAVIGAYSQLSGRGGRFGSYNWVSGSIQGGEANKGTTADDFGAINEVVEFRLTPTSQLPNDKWNVFYSGAVAANAALRIAIGSEDPAVSDEFRNNMSGQALFLRSHFFFELSRHYQNFVYFDETIDPLSFSEIPNGDNLALVVADMERAVGLLPETQSSVGMVNKSAAKAYLGKMMMYQGRFAEAAPILQDVIDNGVTSGGTSLDLLENYSDVFNAESDNNAESLFAIQAAANTGSVNNANYAFDLSHLQGTPIGGCCGFWQPSFDLVNSFRVDASGLPFVDGTYRDGANALVNDQGVESDAAFTADAGPLDPRLDHSVGRRGIPYLDWGVHPGKSWVRDQAHAGPYAPKKFIYYQRQSGTLQDGSSWTGGYTAVNFNIIRFADVLLMAAECYAQGDNLGLAVALVDRVRTRAANAAAFVKNDDGTDAANYQIGTYGSFSSKADALAKVYFERKLELSNEGHRFYDLVRWGEVDGFMPGYLDYEQTFLPLQFGGANYNAAQDQYWPIPQSQLDLQPVLTQNPGY
ncbi:MAG: RagB/SusD family nutrient uptake outer membrane protein [Saprospiraceae bacterium]